MVVPVNLTTADAWKVLENIPDPDIPVISIVELGLVRNVEVEGNKVVVIITPSYSGCPAMYFFKEEIPARLKSAGFEEATTKVSLSPAWTTDWLSNQTKNKLKAHGIAPPEGNAEAEFSFVKKTIPCPWCNSSETNKKSQFGSTPCKAIWFCNSCNQPFEYFKCY